MDAQHQGARGVVERGAGRLLRGCVGRVGGLHFRVHRFDSGAAAGAGTVGVDQPDRLLPDQARLLRHCFDLPR
ncbi:hypothetical protein D3C74_414270 [compost metagenome]